LRWLKLRGTLPDASRLAGCRGAIRARVLLNVEVHHALWADLLETVRSGESASVRVYGASFYEHLSRNRSAGEVFDRAMSSAGWTRDRSRGVRVVEFPEQLVRRGGMPHPANVPRSHGR
jgi:hypothetical protein